MYDPGMNEKRTNELPTEDVITYMNDRGWGFGERGVFNELVVTFHRRDWHGRSIKHPITVTRYGVPEGREELIRTAGREALRIWKRFPESPPAQYFDLQSMSVVWRTSDRTSPSSTLPRSTAARRWPTAPVR